MCCTYGLHDAATRLTWVQRPLLFNIYFAYSSIGAPRSKPCLVNRSRTHSLETASSNEDGDISMSRRNSDVGPNFSEIGDHTSRFSGRMPVRNYMAGAESAANLQFSFDKAETLSTGTYQSQENNSPRLGDRLNLLVDGTRFVVDSELFRAHPNTMLGRYVITWFQHNFDIISRHLNEVPLPFCDNIIDVQHCRSIFLSYHYKNCVKS